MLSKHRARGLRLSRGFSAEPLEGRTLLSAVTGFVFNDINRDGVYGSGEYLTWNRTVWLDLNNDAVLDAGEPSVVTPAPGSGQSYGTYRFDGLTPGQTYHIRTVIPANWLQTLPANNAALTIVGPQEGLLRIGANFGTHDLTQSSTLSGYVFNDANGNGTRSGVDEIRLANQTVYVDADNNGELDSGELSTTTDSAGRFTLKPYNPSSSTTYNVRVVAPQGARQTLPAHGDAWTYTIAPGIGVLPADVFGLQPRRTVTGTVYDDRDASRTINAGDAPLAGRVVYADLNNNLVADTGEPSTLTAQDGSYSLDWLPALSAVWIRQQLPAGWIPTLPFDSTGYSVNLAANQSLVRDFASTETRYRIGGFVFDDDNGNGVQDGKEKVLVSGRTVFLDTDGDNILDSGEQSFTTHLDGFWFENLKAGTYKIGLVVPQGLTESTPASNRTLTVPSPASPTAYIGLAPVSTPNSISGTVFNDSGKNGAWDLASDMPLSGRTVYRDLNNNSILDTGEPTAVTNSLGVYRFLNVPSGLQWIRMQSVSFYAQTVPANDNARVINMGSGSIFSNINFGTAFFSPNGYVHLSLFGDDNGNGLQEGTEPIPVRTAGYFDLDADNVLDANETLYRGTNLLSLPYPVGATQRVLRITGPTGIGPALATLEITRPTGNDTTTTQYRSVGLNGTASIRGLVYNDTLPDGYRQQNELSINGRTVYIDANNNGFLDSTERSAITNSTDEGFRFGGLAPGTYHLRTVIPAGTVQTSPQRNEAITVTVGTSGIATAEFGQLSVPSGGVIQTGVFEDRNGDGIRDDFSFPTGFPTSGWTVYIDSDNDGIQDVGELSSTSTDTAGFTPLIGVPAGVHVLRVAPRTGYEISSPAAGFRTVAVPDGQTVMDGGFGARQATAVTPVTLRANADAYVQDGSYAGQNFGSSTELRLKKGQNVGATREVYLKFDLSSAASVSKAVLRLYGRIDHATQKPQVAVYPAANTSWGESTINWNNRPPIGANGTAGALATQGVAGSTRKWYEFDVTPFLATEKAAGRNLVTLVVRSLTTTDPYLIFSSDEASTNRPELVVTSSGVTASPPPEIVIGTPTVSVAEGGKTSVSLRLSKAPTENMLVTLTRTSGDADLALTSNSSVLFTPTFWNTSFIIGAAEDADALNGSATFTISAAGLTSKTVTATEVDNDTVTPPPPGDTVTLRAIADAFVRDGIAAKTNYGSATELQAKKSSTVGSSREFYLKFDITSLSNVGSAILRLNGQITTTQAPRIAIYAVDDTTWGENTINWNNRPAASVSLATQVVSGARRYYEFDVSSYVRGHKVSGHSTLTFLVRSLDAYDQYIGFSSDESSTNKPQLVVTQDATPAPLRIVVSKSQMSVNEGGTATFTVRLSQRPANEVFVTIERTSGDADLTVNSPAPATALHFDPDTWDIPQTVTLAAAQDADALNGAATFKAEWATMIDPTFVTVTEIDDDAPIGPTIVRVTDDAYVRDGAYANTNYGSTTDLLVKKSANAGNSREAFLRFNISSASATAGSVKLRLWGKSSTSAQAVAMSLIGSSDVGWNESTIKWSNRPGTNPTTIATKTVSGTTGAWYEFDVTNYVRQQRAAGATAVMFILRASATTDAQAIFNSDEAASNRPELVLTP